MQLSYNKLLIDLALDYNNTLLYHSSTVSKYIDKYGSEHLHRMKLKIRKKDQRLQEIEDDIVNVLMLRKRKRLVHEEKEPVARKRGKYEKNSLFFTDPKTGDRSVMTYKHSMWWQNYIVNPQPEKQWWRELFRLRFRLPYDNYIQLAEMCNDSPLFSRWTRNPLQCRRKNKKQGIPIQLLVLCALRYLGRGWLIDDIAEAVVVSPETVRLFVSQFVCLKISQ